MRKKHGLTSTRLAQYEQPFARNERPNVDVLYCENRFVAAITKGESLVFCWNAFC